MPELSTDTERQLYVIRNAADNDDVLLFDQDRVGVTHGKLSADAYCYFVKAADGSDGVQIVSFNYKTRVAYSGNYFWCHKSGWDTDPSFNLYIVPNGIEDKEGFVISHTYPVVDNSCLSNISNIPSYALPMYVVAAMPAQVLISPKPTVSSTLLTKLPPPAHGNWSM